jgi:hypothetical protein
MKPCSFCCKKKGILLLGEWGNVVKTGGYLFGVCFFSQPFFYNGAILRFDVCL